MVLDEFCFPCSRAKRESPGKIWCFHCEETLCEPCETAHVLNKVTFAHYLMSKKPTQIVKSLEKAREIELTDYPDNEIRGITFATNGNILVFIRTEYRNGAVLFLNPKGEILKKCAFTDTFVDITKIPGTDLQVMLKDDSYNNCAVIQFIDTTSLHLGKQVRVDNVDKNGFDVIKIIRDNIYLVGSSTISVLTKDGRHLENVAVFPDDYYVNLKERPSHYKDGHVYLSDGDSLVQINLHGELLFTYGGQCFDKVFGYLIDKNDYLYVCGQKDGTSVVHQLSPDGILLNDEIANVSGFPEKLSNFGVMCFNNDCSEMYFGPKNEDGPNSIVIFTCQSN